MCGSLGGAASTLSLSGLIKLTNRAGLVHETAPEQAVARLEELKLIKERTAGARRVLILAAHYAYGAGAGTAFVLLRRERGGFASEAAVGSALGVLSRGGLEHLAAVARRSRRALGAEHPQSIVAGGGSRILRGGVGDHPPPDPSLTRHV